MSDEHLVGLRENELDKLRSILYSIFDNIDIIYYIRDPLDSAISMMSTQLKAGSCIDSLKEPKYFKLGDQWKIIQKFRTAFETATFIVRRFEKQALERADVVTDFYKQLNVDAKKYCFTSSRRKNVSLSLTGMKFLLKLNIEFPMIIDGVYDRGHMYLPKIVLTTLMMAQFSCRLLKNSRHIKIILKFGEKDSVRIFPW